MASSVRHGMVGSPGSTENGDRSCTLSRQLAYRPPLMTPMMTSRFPIGGWHRRRKLPAPERCSARNRRRGSLPAEESTPPRHVSDDSVYTDDLAVTGPQQESEESEVDKTAKYMGRGEITGTSGRWLGDVGDSGAETGYGSGRHALSYVDGQRKGEQGSRGGLAVSPSGSQCASFQRELNGRLVSAGVGEVLRLVERHYAAFDAVNASTALRCLARRRATTSAPSQRLTAALDRLCELLLPELHTCAPRTLASSAHSLAKLRFRRPEVFVELGVAALARAWELKPQDISNILWAFATARFPAPELFAVLAGAAAARAGQFKPQEVGNTLWALARAGQADVELLEAFQPVVVAKAADFNAQNVANTLWAYAVLGQRSIPVFDALSAHAARHAADFSAQNLANTVWAVATAGHRSRTLFDAVAVQVELRGGELNPQELSMTAWAYVKAGLPAPGVFATVAKHADLRAYEHAPKALAILMWVFASGRHDARELFDSLTRVAVEEADQLSARDIASVVWAYARLDYPPAALRHALLPQLMRQLTHLSATELCNVVWAMAALGLLRPATLRALAPHLRAQHPFFRPAGYAQLLQADILLAPPPDASLLPSTVAEAAREYWGELRTPETSADPESTASTCSLLGQVHDCLTRAGVTASMRYISGVVEACAVAELDGRRVVLCALTESECSRSTPCRPLGEALVRRRVLKAQGWEVLEVPFFEWELLESENDRAAYLCGRLSSSSTT